MKRKPEVDREFNRLAIVITRDGIGDDFFKGLDEIRRKLADGIVASSFPTKEGRGEFVLNRRTPKGGKNGH